jgi:hypothetical protein
MLRAGKIEILKQEQEGDYLFLGEGVKPVCTKGFIEAFGDEYIEVAFTSQYLVTETYPNPDYLQKYTYKDITYWCIGEFHKGDTPDMYIDTPFLYITFLLPNEY